MTAADGALVELGLALVAGGYRFVTPTPETHRRVNARPESAEARTLRDVFGWSRPFGEGVLDPDIASLLERAEAVERLPGGLARSRVRFSTAGSGLYVHTAYPTREADAVFFGPDTYRFLALLSRTVNRARRAVDVGCGSGAGGLSLLDRVERVVLADVSPRALRFARVNAAISAISASGAAAGARAEVELVESDVLSSVEGPFDLVVANPPYLADAERRVYRDGGGALGTSLSTRIAEEALARLEPGGRLVLYTASPVVNGRHLLAEALEPLAARAASAIYEELDPDVFGEELDREPYREVERIAVVAFTCTKQGAST